MSSETLTAGGQSDDTTDIVNETLNLVNETFKATPQGQAVAYSSLVLMAVVPIMFGSYRSVKYLEEQQVSGEKPETITKKDAMKFPIIASGMLLSIYAFFKVFSQQYIDIAIGVYFFVLGVFAMAHIAGPFFKQLIPEAFPNCPYHLHLTEGDGESRCDLMDWSFDRKDLVTIAICAVIAGWYGLQKHWIANNLIGLAFAMNGVELLQLNSIATGCILLGGLFFYDVFWVFGTNVMITVAKNFNAPIKVVFPQDFIEQGIFGKHFAMLGLGDIVIPGIFIALLLRFDTSLKRNEKTYFYSGFVAYFLGLVATIVVMVVFKHPQPALLYLVPACLGVPLAVAYLKGDWETMFKYTDEKNWETGTEDKSEKKKE
uniref:PSL3 presenilin-like protein 3 n=1 Tax=Phallusia mammillata TaxID=59560 RepID=A0A6F9DQE9_9ASCI|nr:PSL3 presenilin-like protein 3 [Phallusia mammillata]